MYATASATDGFTAQGSGGWFMGAEGQTTRFAVGINSTNVGQMLAKLGVACLEPVVVAVHRASLCVRRARCITPANACAAGSA